MRVLLVEDEEHKQNDLINRLYKNGVRQDQLTVAQGVREAVIEAELQNFDLIVLDMALPTHSKASGSVAQAVGGVEVLRTLQALGRRSAIIIVTQYPDVIVNGQKVKLQNVAKVLSARYEQEILGGILYSFNMPKWEASFDALVGVVNARGGL
ncbi:response regulator [Rhizobium sp. PP-CC-3G-465]|uniref:response regulator n=1 Tax=Rhizobium sp. PP-CC-3G-465 TaxID=2135648 RepID=UPI001049915F